METIVKKDYLDDVLYSYRMSHIKDQTDAYKAAAGRLQKAVKEHYGDKIYDTFLSGSIAKHTAVNTKFDIDFVIPFRHDSFATLQEMSDDVYAFLDKYKSRKENIDICDSSVKKQKVSIGFEYRYFDNGVQKTIPIDVVPGRELSQGDYEETESLNLFFRDSTWGFMSDEGSRQKTNIAAQGAKICGKDNERKMIRLLKIWKKANGKNVKSFVLELFVLKALEDYDGAKDLWSLLQHTLQFIRDNATNESCHLYDPGNSNNDVLARMDKYERSLLYGDMKNLLYCLENIEGYIKQAFPENSKFKRPKDTYGTNVGRQMPLPPDNRRFG